MSLYERLGGELKIARIAADIFDTHTTNPTVANRYQDSDRERVIKMVTEFLCAGTGGPQDYTGKSMPEAHRCMNINEAEYLAVIDDIMAALDKNEVGELEKQELLMIAYSLKGEIIGM
ncbi:group 1 truncated hemoglobin [Shewanella benthica]|uniref:group I truncated hemoglobin n=1 Tax=Shewanella benthica TaxID=43661 RepID=UPI00187A7A78|nr:group 1 truncated hemoglobin [Shewanella benthica]MBE7216299.1 group 1 truncated hemoglobin [Shewanella benthica]MCL1064401.1 group 1 truncated hemoglobin [Shewanella benthica]